MTGGLMNLTTYGKENLILNGNPKKTYFKATYTKCTNFGLQRFRIDYQGSRVLNLTTPTVFNFKIPRYAELLHDTYLSVTLPDIYSPFHYDPAGTYSGNKLIPYEFRWIEEIGSNMIQEVEIHSGGTTLARYPGEYLSCLVQRDYNDAKKHLWNKMTGNVPEINDPGSANGNVNIYPHSMYIDDTGIQPSIRTKKLYIPLDAFFCDSSKMALPLVSLQYQEVSIKITIAPVADLYTINNVHDVRDGTGLSYRIRPNPNNIDEQPWHFLQEPRDILASQELYDTTRNDWNADVHLMATYIFLGQEERRVFAQNEHKLLIKQCYTYDHLGVAGSKIVEMESKDLVINYMWRFRRSDAKERNEWSNYTNWAYNNVIPQTINDNLPLNDDEEIPNPNNFHITGPIGDYDVNQKDILINMGIVMGGVYRENVMQQEVFNYIEKYNRTHGNAKDGLYCYNFALDNRKKNYQPSGGMNVNRFPTVMFEFNTVEPPFDAEGAVVDYICDTSNNPIGFRKSPGQINQYNFDLRVFEERYNVLVFTSGRVGLMNAR